eukprot:6459661-Heterocapsa_arctica.AAC.1
MTSPSRNGRNEMSDRPFSVAMIVNPCLSRVLWTRERMRESRSCAPPLLSIDRCLRLRPVLGSQD